MKISWRWLQRHVDLDGIDPRDLFERFTMSVAELEELDEVGASLSQVVAARIEAVEPHPGADKLKLVTVDLGGRNQTVVCGAPNCAVGLVVPYIPVGTTIGELTVEAREIRGVVSRGVLASERDLELTDDHSGLLVLPEDTAPGTPLTDLVPEVHDFVFDIDNKSLTHRPDLWGHRGIAREISLLTDRPMKPQPLDIEWGTEDVLTVEVLDPERCPRYTAVRYEGVYVEPSPLWLKVLISRVGMRPISNIVDLSNYVMLDTCNPIHAFDGGFLRDSKIIVRRAEEGEILTTLDKTERKMTREDLFITDGGGPVALAGVMGGLDSEIVPSTTAVVLESAVFHAAGIRRTSVRVGLRSEASTRFEKSIDPEAAMTAQKLFGTMIMELCPGSKPVSKLYDVDYSQKEPLYVDTSVSFIERKLGAAVGRDFVVKVLEGLGFELNWTGDDAFSARVPTWRATKDISIPEDLVEEVGRIYGYDNIVPRAPKVAIKPPRLDPRRRMLRQLKHLVGFVGGFHEVLSYSFDSEEMIAKLFAEPPKRIKVENPISSDHTHMRVSLLPNLLHFVEENTKTFDTVRLFEVGRVFDGPEMEQPYKLGLVAAQKGEHELFRVLKGMLEEQLAVRRGLELRVEALGEAPLYPYLKPTRCGALVANGVTVGAIGELHPTTARTLKLEGYSVCVVEVDLEAVEGVDKPETLFQPLPRYPAISIDVSVIVDEAATHAAVVDAIKGIGDGAELIRKVELFSIYREPPIPEGKKSMSYAIELRSDTATLTDAQAGAVQSAIIGALEAKLGGYVRTA